MLASLFLAQGGETRVARNGHRVVAQTLMGPAASTPRWRPVAQAIASTVTAGTIERRAASPTKLARHRWPASICARGGAGSIGGLMRRRARWPPTRQLRQLNSANSPTDQLAAMLNAASSCTLIRPRGFVER
jgi:hypothetical protein